MAEVQAKAGVEAKEYAREKLDRLSTILEGLREVSISSLLGFDDGFP